MNERAQINSAFNTIVDAYRHFAEVKYNKVAYTYKDYNNKNNIKESSITFGELDKRARSLAAYLLGRRAEGKRVIILFTFGLEYIEAYFGCLYAGAIPVPAYSPDASSFFSQRLHWMITDSQASFVLTTSVIKESIECEFIELITDYNLSWITLDTIIDDFSDKWNMPLIRKDSMAFLQYTSGSTSTPKGVIVTHSNLLHNISLIGSCFKPLLEKKTENLNAVIWLPPFHDMGLIGGILALPYHGVTVHLMSPFAFMQQPYRWLEAISNFRSQISAAPNFAFDYCIKNISEEQKQRLNLSSWKIVFNGAEVIKPIIMEEFTKVFEPFGFRKETFYPCYGLAESSLIVSGGLMEAKPIIKAFDKSALEENIVVECDYNEKNAKALVGCGTKLSDGEIIIVNPHTTSLCKSNELGEIWLKSPSISKGYWNNSKLTDETFKATITDTQDGPFLRTGDLGFIYEEELFITGRLKDLIIINGRDINPNDIEHTVEVIHPLFCMNNNAAFSIEIDEKEVLTLVQEVRSEFKGIEEEEVKSEVAKVIKEIYDIDIYDIIFIKRGSIRKTSSGKIQRRACKEDYLKKVLEII
ncbi:fatty acyl-AMP ligase [Clostridium sp. DJ247]|uniref:fatty acyl-AMP ligase n=1 Tax=Clostridium sp. DJ247 TaxID=2726188 RepID=UPI0016287376|nr:fatty acyl-AMP ligase [Clostridium sp. DJ247]MBC2581090.1 fatty acyl-AMP ligase [Clostridium sp. DJ247]